MTVQINSRIMINYEMFAIVTLISFVPPVHIHENWPNWWLWNRWSEWTVKRSFCLFFVQLTGRTPTSKFKWICHWACNFPIFPPFMASMSFMVINAVFAVLRYLPDGILMKFSIMYVMELRYTTVWLDQRGITRELQCMHFRC